MVRGRGGKPQEILSASEKESLMGERQEAVSALKERESYGKGTAAEQMDENKLKRQIKQIDDAIAAREMPKVSGADKDKMVKELETLTNTLQVDLPTRYEMDQPTKNPGAVRKHMRWVDRNKVNVERWRYLQRVLNPDNPQSVENLRRDK